MLIRNNDFTPAAIVRGLSEAAAIAVILAAVVIWASLGAVLEW